MRIIYCDEAGSSRLEPVIVVAGVMIDADKQLIAVEEYLDALAAQYISEADLPHFVFHATEIWSGNKYFADRGRWPLKKRLDILKALADIPRRFDIPIAIGFIEKKPFWDEHEKIGITPPPPPEADIFLHAITFSECAMSAEITLRHISKINSAIGLLIAENRPEVHKVVKDSHAFLQNPKLVADAGFQTEHLPLRRIRDTVHFAKKSESRPLQLADACAFFTKGHLIKNEHAEEFYQMILPQLGLIPKADMQRA